MSFSGSIGYWLWTAGFVAATFFATIVAGGIARVVVGMDEDCPRTGTTLRRKSNSEKRMEPIRWFDREPGGE